MMLATTTLLGLLASTSAIPFNSTSFSSSIPTVTTLSLASYQGHWFQMFDNRRAQVFYPSGGSRCITADYQVRVDGTVGVHNYGITNKEGKINVIDGYAYVKDDNQPGQLTLQLEGVPVEADYWVVEVGPLNGNQLYDWALVSSKKAPHSSVYILARDVNVFRVKYETELLEKAKSYGFDGYLNKPQATYQEEDCVYDYQPDMPLVSLTTSKFRPDTVKELDLNSYVGLWYQMAADSLVMKTFEKDAYCVTAKYGLNNDGTISVRNTDNRGGASGPLSMVDGYAFGDDLEKYPGRLKVHFTTEPSSPVDAPYWVLELGPVNAESKLYDWAIVSDNFSSFLFVLARNVDTFNEVYRDEVYAKLDTLGFKGRKAPIDTYHGADCQYEK